jgi:hypothetical protein
MASPEPKIMPGVSTPATLPNAPEAPNVSPNDSAVSETNPAEPTAKVKRPPIKRVTHPALKPDADGNPTVKLDAWPEDFSSVKHKALAIENFTSEAVMLNEQARLYEKKAADLRQQAKDCLTLGSTEDRKNVKKVRDIIGQLGELTSSLAGKGVNITDMIQGLQALLQKQATEQAAASGTNGAGEAASAVAGTTVGAV